jgi:hypothetical protein
MGNKQASSCYRQQTYILDNSPDFETSGSEAYCEEETMCNDRSCILIKGWKKSSVEALARDFQRFNLNRIVQKEPLVRFIDKTYCYRFFLKGYEPCIIPK